MNVKNRSKRRAPAKYAAMLIAGLVAIFVFWNYTRSVKDGMEWYRASELRLIAPDFEAGKIADARQVPDFTLTDRFGNKVRLSQFESIDVLLVNIWSSGCPVCRDEVPELTEMDRRLASIGKVALLTIAIDEKWEDVAEFFPRGTDLRVLFDPENEVGEGIFGTKKYPETFVLDRKRRIRARFDGRRPWHSDTMMDYLSSFL